MKSRCCNEDIFVEGNVTMYYVCRNCYNPTDPKSWSEKDVTGNCRENEKLDKTS